VSSAGDSEPYRGRLRLSGRSGDHSAAGPRTASIRPPPHERHNTTIESSAAHDDRRCPAARSTALRARHHRAGARERCGSQGAVREPTRNWAAHRVLTGPSIRRKVPASYVTGRYIT
jgi:hypothetical protein